MHTQAWVLGIVIFLNSCGSWSGNPPKDPPPETVTGSTYLTITTPKLKVFDIKNSLGEVKGRLSLSSARFVIADVSVFNDTKPSPPQFSGPFVVDLLNLTVTPDPVPKDIPVGTYKRLAFSLTNASQAKLPTMASDDRLLGNSFQIEGSLEVDGKVEPFVYVLPIEFPIELIPQNISIETSTISAQSLNKLEVIMDYSKWFQTNQPADVLDPFQMVLFVKQGIEEGTQFKIGPYP